MYDHMMKDFSLPHTQTNTLEHTHTHTHSSQANSREEDVRPYDEGSLSHTHIQSHTFIYSYMHTRTTGKQKRT